MERETINIEKNELFSIIQSEKNNNYILIEDKIHNSDPEDGGADHEVVIKRIADNKFFAFYYQDWDVNYNFNRDFPEELEEVFAKQITITVYE